MIHNMVGGGSGKLFSVIAVTYPEGSVCTCSNGTKTLKARDTSGQALFNVSIGTWTVSCTDGSRTKSTQVSITADGQNVSVTLQYQFWLFRGSDDYMTPSVGGWESYGYVLQSGSPLGGGKLVHGELRCLGVINEYEGGVGTKNAVDLSGYSKLVINGWSESKSLRTIFVTKSKNPIVGNTLASALLPDSTGTVSIDISAINEGAYVVFTSKAGEGYSYVYNAYLE